MYANTEIATDRARRAIHPVGRWLGLATRRRFLTMPMPQLQVPEQPTAPPVRLLTMGRR
jgi:hypothetical protein